MSNAEGLKSLGSEKTEYELSVVKPALLESFDNLHPDNDYVVPFVMEHEEFTSLCPKTKQPDTARVEVLYVPDKKCLESKSLKLYLFSFRNHGSFHEDCMNQVANNIFNLIQPKYIRVFGEFSPRGGIAIRPIVEKWGAVHTDDEKNTVNRLVDAWDKKDVRKRS